MSSASPNLRLHIGTLVVEGVPGLSRAQLAEAVQHELQSRLGEHTEGMQAGHRERVDGGSFNLRPTAGSRALGGQIATAVQHAVLFP